MESSPTSNTPVKNQSMSLKLYQRVYLESSNSSKVCSPNPLMQKANTHKCSCTLRPRNVSLPLNSTNSLIKWGSSMKWMSQSHGVPAWLFCHRSQGQLGCVWTWKRWTRMSWGKHPIPKVDVPLLSSQEQQCKANLMPTVGSGRSYESNLLTSHPLEGMLLISCRSESWVHPSYFRKAWARWCYVPDGWCTSLQQDMIKDAGHRNSACFLTLCFKVY